MTMIHKLLPNLLAGGRAASATPTPAPDTEGHIALHYSDGTAPSVGLEAVKCPVAQHRHARERGADTG